MSAITESQIKRFWVALTHACNSLCIYRNDEREEYRKRILKEEGGVLHLKDLSRTEGYDKVMAKLAIDAGDYGTAIKYAESTAYRLIAVLEQKAKAIVGPLWEHYVQGIMEQSGIGADRHSLKDCTEPEIRGLIAIIDTKLRRTKRATTS